MNILVLGSGGRKHAICKSLKKSPLLKKLWCLPGNAGTYKLCNKSSITNLEFDNILKEFLNLIIEINDWNRDNIQNAINDFLKNNEIKFPVLGKPIRFLLINSYQGPSISDIFIILGKNDTIDRLNQYRGD